MKKLKKIPKFKTMAQEKKFWDKNDTTDFFDWTQSKEISFPNLKPSVKSISLRLTESMLNDLKILANKKDVPYQSLMKLYLSEKIKEEHSH